MKKHKSSPAPPGRIYGNSKPMILRPGETRHISINFRDMHPCPLRYELDPQSGKITEDGLYTASERQGVHTIRVTCKHDPLIYTFATVDVRE